MSELKKQTVSGVKWVFAASVIQRGLSFITTIILARLLMPADFGLFALAFVMIDAFGVFKSLGFDSALVRRKDDIKEAANTAFFLIPAMGMIIFIALIIFAPVGAKMLSNPPVANIIRALAIIFVIGCFGKVPQMILYRDMKFKYGTISDLTSQVAYVSTALILAFNKFGVWSLVIAYITRTVFKIALDWYFSGWKPKLEFKKSIALDMFHFGKYVWASSVILFLYANLDNMVIGKLLGVTMLGYYAITKNTSNFLSDYFLSKVSAVMYPAYSKIQHDKEDIKRIMLKSFRYISIIAFPFSLGLFIFAPDILRIVFGAKWLPATDILRILAFVGVFNSLATVISPIFLARGQSKADFQVGLAQVGIFFILVIPLAFKLRLVGVGLALLISTVVSFFIGLIRIKKIIDIKLLKIFQAIKPALLCSLLMLSIILILKYAIITKNIYFNFFIPAGISALFYFLVTYMLNKKALKEIREVLI